jgi:hypothetical protein
MANYQEDEHYSQPEVVLPQQQQYPQQYVPTGFDQGTAVPPSEVRTTVS